LAASDVRSIPGEGIRTERGDAAVVETSGERALYDPRSSSRNPHIPIMPYLEWVNKTGRRSGAWNISRKQRAVAFCL
ncbi:MAG: hypothetical protein KGL02_10910, partial [Acidobacteriota bacterium]|nr:hypothetical protein [Acidobacteriota bacterium]